MEQAKFNPRTLILFLYILVIVALRVLAPLMPDFQKVANFTVLGAVALFGGAYFSNNLKAFGFPIFALLISDLILGAFVYKNSGFLYEGWYWTYTAFALMVVAGKLIMRKVNVTNFLLSAVVVLLIHWIVSDLGVWLGSAFYPQTLSGFWACLTAAIPFERSFLFGTLLYGALMFGSFELLKAKFPSLRASKVSV